MRVIIGLRKKIRVVIADARFHIQGFEGIDPVVRDECKYLLHLWRDEQLHRRIIPLRTAAGARHPVVHAAIRGFGGDHIIAFPWAEIRKGKRVACAVAADRIYEYRIVVLTCHGRIDELV